MNWNKLSIQNRLFFVLAVLLGISCFFCAGKQAFTAADLELEQVRNELLPCQMRQLEYQIRSEIDPLILASKVMANDQFVEKWISEGAPEAEQAVLEKSLKEMHAALGSDFTFHTLETPDGTEYFQHSDNGAYHTMLDDYQYKGFYPAFLATGKEYELNMQATGGTFILYINYRSSAVNPLSEKPYTVAGLGLKVDRLIDLVKELHIGEEGFAMLVTAEGDVQIAGQEVTVDKSQLAEFLKVRDKLTIEELEINGEKYFVGALWVASLDRFLVAQVPFSQITGPVYRQLLTTLIYTLILVLFSLIALHFIIKRLTLPISEISRDVHHITENLDLSYTIRTEDQAEIGTLAEALNRLLSTLQESLKTVNDAVENTGMAMSDLNRHADELHQSSQENREATEQIFTATQDITEQSAQVTKLANEAGELSHRGNTELRNVSDEMQNSLSHLHNLKEEMYSSKSSLAELNAHLERILSVLEVITSISQQTNLLAINAAVEAARAGSHGKGFAVVADEVRMLSQKTSESTAEIEEIIAVLRKASEDVTEMIHSASTSSVKTLEGQMFVAEKVTELDQFMQQLFEMNKQVAERATIQHGAVADINVHMETLGARNEQTASLFSQNREATEAIGSQMSMLKERVEQFKTAL